MAYIQIKENAYSNGDDMGYEILTELAEANYKIRREKGDYNALTR
jgi:hypothetical protein